MEGIESILLATDEQLIGLLENRVFLEPEEYSFLIQELRNRGYNY